MENERGRNASREEEGKEMEEVRKGKKGEERWKGNGGRCCGQSVSDLQHHNGRVTTCVYITVIKTDAQVDISKAPPKSPVLDRAIVRTNGSEVKNRSRSVLDRVSVRSINPQKT